MADRAVGQLPHEGGVPGPWREALIHRVLDFPQQVDSTWMAVGPTNFRGRPAYRLQAAWRNPPEAAWPAGGPFITRAVVCHDQNRVYLIDAWLYAPDRDKYEYMIQLETILDSFRCGGAGGAVETQPPSETRLERVGV